MKIVKSFNLVTLGVLLLLSSSLSWSLQEYELNIRFSCPRTKLDGGSPTHVLFNDGITIQGYGEEEINGQQLPNPLFTVPTPSANIPLNLESGNYYRYGTSYDPATGIVYCHYVSSIGYAPFVVSYRIHNGRSGMLDFSNPGFIVINYQFGFSKA